MPEEQKNRKLRGLKLLVVTCAIALLSGASFAQDEASGVLRVGVRQEPDSMNHHITQFAIAYEIIGTVYESLVGKDLEGKPTNSALAESWVRSDDGLTWTLKLNLT